MKIMEKLNEACTYNPLNNEDGLFVNENFIVVIDGTSKGDILWDGKPGGRYIKDTILTSLSKLNEDIDAKDALEFLNNDVKLAYKENYELVRTVISERVEASIIIFSRKKQEIWNYGDCSCKINGKLYHHNKRIDEILYDVRALFNKLKLLEGTTPEEIMEEDFGREYINPIIKKQSLFANSTDKEYGFSVLDGLNIIPENINIYKVNKGDEIILASDGYPELKNTLEASEKLLKDVLKNDPLLINDFKSTKCLNKEKQSYDDRTYIRFIV